jgi:hypothetical protein
MQLCNNHHIKICVSVIRQNSTTLPIDRHDRENTAPEGRGSIESPFDGGHKQWTEEMLRNLRQKKYLLTTFPLPSCASYYFFREVSLNFTLQFIGKREKTT